MKNPFVDERGRTLHSHKMMPLLGLKPGGHLPVEGMGTRDINGVMVYVLAKFRSGRHHRIIAICPACKKHVPFGRMGQHVKVHSLGDGKPQLLRHPERGEFFGVLRVSYEQNRGHVLYAGPYLSGVFRNRRDAVRAAQEWKVHP